MAFNNYLEEVSDKPYFTKNSLAYYYDKMEGFAKAVEGSAKALNLTKEEIEQRIALRLAEWDKNLESFDGSVEKLLTEWVDDGTLTHVIDSTLIDQKIAPVALQLADIVTYNLVVTNETDITQDLKNAINFINSNGGGTLNIPFRIGGYNVVNGEIPVCSNLTITGNNNVFNVQSSDVNKNVFILLNHENVTVKDLSFVSSRDKLAIRHDDPKERYSSNIYAVSIKGCKKLKFSNLYFDGLESGLWYNNGGTGTNVTVDSHVDNIVSVNTNQPIYLVFVKDSYFSNLNIDCHNNYSGHDHCLYINGGVNNLFFSNLIFIDNQTYPINIKVDNTSLFNTNIHIRNADVSGGGINLANAKNIHVSNIDLKAPISTGSAMAINSGCDNVNIEGFSINGFNSAISSLGLTNNYAKSVKISNGIIEGNLGHTVIVKFGEFVFANVKFKGMPREATARIFYGATADESKIILKNCEFIFNQLPPTQPISMRGIKNEMIVDSCFFFNNAETYAGIMYNVAPAIVVGKGNYYKGFTAFKIGADVVTTEINSVAIPKT